MRCYDFNFKLYVVAAVATAGWLAPSLSVAANDVWKTAASGTWSAGANWVDGSTPSSIFDQATFNLAGAYTVSFTADPDPIGALTLTSAANVTLASSSRPPNPIPPRSLSLVDTSGANTGDLVLSNGSTLTLGATSADRGSHPFHLTAGGKVRVDPTATLNLKFGSIVTTSGSDALNGTINVSAGSLIQNGDGTIGDSAAVTVAGAGSRLVNASLLKIGQRINLIPGSSGALSISGGGRGECLNATVGGDFTGGTVTVTGSGSLWQTTNRLAIGESGPGTVNIQPQGTASVGQETVIHSQGRLRLQGGTFDTGEFRVESGGQFEWTAGTFHLGTHHGDLSFAVGTLAPGHSPGSTTVLGNYTQQSVGILEMEIGGAAQGTQYDVVNVTGNAQLGGQLDLKLINGFAPTLSQTFVILSANAVAGAFNNVASGQRLAASAGGGSFLVHYGPGSAFAPALVVLSEFQASLAGDFDSDGDVDGRDFLVWQRGGSPNPLSGGDLALWRSNYGAPSVASGAAVPEPSAAWLAAAVVVLWLGRPDQARRSARTP